LLQFRKGTPGDYLLHTWVVMPNHVHLLLTPKIEPSIALQRLKGASARNANKLLGLGGQPFWQAESYDHLVRSQEQFERIEHYILRTRSERGLLELRKSTPGRAASAG
jgi:putative transposase